MYPSDLQARQMKMTTPAAMRPKTVLITGCSDGGLGSALALELANNSRNYHVIATARNPAKLSHLRDNPNITLMTLDVLSEASIQSCLASVSAQPGSLDMLINNAGNGLMSPLSDIQDLNACRQNFDLNVWAVLAMTQAFLPLLIESKGVIVMNSSVASVVPVPGMGVYNASKAALSMLTDTLRLEVAPFGVRVVELKTGSVESNFHDNVGRTELPADSLYAPIKEEMEALIDGTSKEDANRRIAADVWAKQVVDQLVKSDPPAKVWKGGGSVAIYWMTTLPLQRFMNETLAKVAGLMKLAQLLGTGEKPGT
jgi:1-acylglycerone phosphate reductase